MKRKGREYKPFILGICFCFGILMMILPLILFRSSVRCGKNIFCVRFVDISGISEGAAVYFAGKPVGKVGEIRNIIDQGDKNPAGYLYTYELVLKIENGSVILPEDEITLTFPRLIGEKVVNICPRDLGERKLTENHRFYGRNLDIFRRGEDLMVAMESFSQLLSQNTRQVVESICELTESCSGLVHQVQDQSVLSNLSEVLERLKEGTEIFGKEGALALTEAIDNVHEITNDIRDYGILYQYDKNWKKKRTRVQAKSEIPGVRNRLR